MYWLAGRGALALVIHPEDNGLNRRLRGSATFTVASFVAISRMHDQRHFASDVAAGAAEGTIIGRSVSWHGRNFYASPMLLPKGGALMVSVTP